MDMSKEQKDSKLLKYLTKKLQKKEITTKNFLKLLTPSNLEEKSFYGFFGSIKTHNGPIERILVNHSQNRTCLISGGLDGLIKIFDIDKQMLIQTLYGHLAHVIDICLHPDGIHLVSVDIQGILLIHRYDTDLDAFVIMSKRDIGEEVMFCEFIKGHEYCKLTELSPFIPLRNTQDPNAAILDYELVVLTTTGTLVCLNIITGEEIYKNTCLKNNPIKAICITDGGRFIFTGGVWPYLLVFDVYSGDKLVVLEDFTKQIDTSEISITNVTAARNTFMVATSFLNTVCIYAPRNRKIVKYFIDITEYNKQTGSVVIEVYKMAFILSGLLVVLGTDRILRIYEKDTLVCIKEDVSLGSIYTHSTEDVFCITNDRIIRFYEVIGDKIVEHESISIFISVSDCLFSNNGEYFITCDDSGAINTYKLNFIGQATKSIQFFEYDLSGSYSKSKAEIIDLLFKVNLENINFISYLRNHDSEETSVKLILLLDKMSPNERNFETQENANRFLLKYLYSETYNPGYPNEWWTKLKYDPVAKQTGTVWILENKISRFLYQSKFNKDALASLEYLVNDISEEAEVYGDTTVLVTQVDGPVEVEQEYNATDVISLINQPPVTENRRRLIIDESSEEIIKRKSLNKDKKPEKKVDELTKHMTAEEVQLHDSFLVTEEESEYEPIPPNKEPEYNGRVLRRTKDEPKEEIYTGRVLRRNKGQIRDDSDQTDSGIKLRSHKRILLDPEEIFDTPIKMRRSLPKENSEQNHDEREVPELNKGEEEGTQEETSAIENLSIEDLRTAQKEHSEIEEEEDSSEVSELGDSTDEEESLEAETTVSSEEQPRQTQPRKVAEYKTKEKDNVATLIKNTPFRKKKELMDQLEDDVKKIKSEEEIVSNVLTDSEYVKMWFDSLQINKNDEIYLDSKALKNFALKEKRVKTTTNLKSGIYTIKEIKPTKMYFHSDPTNTTGAPDKYVLFVKLCLIKSGQEYNNVCFYESRQEPNGIFCLKSQKECFRLFDSVSIVGSDIRGPIEAVENLKVKIGDEWYLQSEIYMGNPKNDLTHYTIEDAADFPTPYNFINYARINYRIAHRIYRNKKELLRDLNQIRFDFKSKDKPFYDHIESIIANVKD